MRERERCRWAPTFPSNSCPHLIQTCSIWIFSWISWICSWTNGLVLFALWGQTFFEILIQLVEISQYELHRVTVCLFESVFSIDSVNLFVFLVVSVSLHCGQENEMDFWSNWIGFRTQPRAPLYVSHREGILKNRLAPTSCFVEKEKHFWSFLWIVFSLKSTQLFFRRFTTPCKPPIGITSEKVTKFCVALPWGVGLVL